MKSLLLLSLAPFVYTAVSPDPSPSQNQEGVYKCRQFKLSLTKPDGKDTHFKISTKTLLKKLVVSKKAVLVKKSDLPKVQSALQEEESKEKSDAQANPSDVVVVEKPASKPFWQKIIQRIYGNRIIIFGVHVDGEVSDKKPHGMAYLSGALCSPYDQQPGEVVSDLVETATGVIEQIAEELTSEEEEKPAPQLTVTEGAGNPQETTPATQPASSGQGAAAPPGNAAAPPPVEAAQNTESPTTQQVPLLPLQSSGTDRVVITPQPYAISSVQARPLYDNNDVNNSMIAPKEIRGIRDYVAK